MIHKHERERERERSTMGGGGGGGGGGGLGKPTLITSPACSHVTMLEKFSLSEPITMSSEADSERKRERQSAGPHECPGRKCCGVLVTLGL